MRGFEHWHEASWPVDMECPADWCTSVLRRPRLVPGAVHVVDRPDSPLWQRQGYGAWIDVRGDLEIAGVVWRCNEIHTK